MTKEELFRRLGVPAYRHRCPQCGSYCGEMVHAWDHTQGDSPVPLVVCRPCCQIIGERNVAHVRRKVQNEVQYEVANIEYRASQQRPSNYEYLAACERMRREGW